MLPKKKLAKAEQEGDDTIIRGANAKQSFAAVNNLHFDTGNATSFKGKMKHSSGEDSDDEDSSVSRSVSHKIHQGSPVEPPSKRARIEQTPTSAHRQESKNSADKGHLPPASPQFSGQKMQRNSQGNIQG